MGDENGEAIDVSDIGVERTYWRWRSATPYRPPPYDVYTYIAVGLLTDGRWFVEEQHVDSRARAFAAEEAAMACAHEWMAGSEWVTQYTPVGRGDDQDVSQA